MKDKKFIITLILIILMDGLGLFGWFYFFSLLKNQSDLIQEKRQNIANSEKKLQNNNSLKTLMEEISPEKEKVDSAFLNDDNLAAFVEKLESTAALTNTFIKIGNIAIDSSGKNGLSVEFSLEGNFQQIFHYLVLLENLPYLLNIERMDFGSLASGRWNADFKILVTSFLKT